MVRELRHPELPARADVARDEDRDVPPSGDYAQRRAKARETRPRRANGEVVREKIVSLSVPQADWCLIRGEAARRDMSMMRLVLEWIERDLGRLRKECTDC